MLIILVANKAKRILPIKTQPIMVDVITLKNKHHQKVNLSRLKNIHIASTKNQISSGNIIAKEKTKITQPKGIEHERYAGGFNSIKKRIKIKHVRQKKRIAAKLRPHKVLPHKKLTGYIINKAVSVVSIKHHSIFKSVKQLALNHAPKSIQGKSVSRIGVRNGKGAAKKEAVISIATKNIKYASYMAHIKQLVQSVWIYPDEALEKNQSGMLYLVFIINKNGTLASVKLIRTSGYSILDKAAINALKEASPFPSIPLRLDIDRLKVYASFRYNLSFDTEIY